jgi:lactobin A/cerein 7B family class IIb bacteriocin
MNQNIDGFVELNQAELESVDGGAWYDIVNTVFTQVIPAIGQALEGLFQFGMNLFNTIKAMF